MGISCRLRVPPFSWVRAAIQELHGVPASSVPKNVIWREVGTQSDLDRSIECARCRRDWFPCHRLFSHLIRLIASLAYRSGTPATLAISSGDASGFASKASRTRSMLSCPRSRVLFPIFPSSLRTSATMYLPAPVAQVISLTVASGFASRKDLTAWRLARSFGTPGSLEDGDFLFLGAGLPSP